MLRLEVHAQQAPIARRVPIHLLLRSETDDHIVQLLASELANEKGLGLVHDERKLHLSLRDDSIWRHALPRLGMSRFFGIVDRFQQHESDHWHERTYGLATLCCELGLIGKVGEQTLSSNGSASKGGGDKLGPGGSAMSLAVAKQEAFQIKRARGNVVDHAFCMYSDVENKYKQEIIANVCSPLRLWHQRQNRALRSTDTARDWRIDECHRDYDKHLADIAATCHSFGPLCAMGFEVELEASDHEEELVGCAICATQDALANHLGSMAVGMLASRLRWGVDFLMPSTRRSCLLVRETTSDGFIAEWRRANELFQRLRGHQLAPQSRNGLAAAT